MAGRCSSAVEWTWKQDQVFGTTTVVTWHDSFRIFRTADRHRCCGMQRHQQRPVLPNPSQRVWIGPWRSGRSPSFRTGWGPDPRDARPARAATGASLAGLRHHRTSSREAGGDGEEDPWSGRRWVRWRGADHWMVFWVGECSMHDEVMQLYAGSNMRQPSLTTTH